MKKTLKKIYKDNLLSLDEEKRKLFSLVTDYIEFDEMNCEARLFKLLNRHITFYLDVDYNTNDSFYVRQQQSDYYDRRPIDSTSHTYENLTPHSLQNEPAREFLIGALYNELEKVNTERLLRLVMLPATKSFYNKSHARDTLMFSNWLHKSNTWYDVLFESRINHEHVYTYYPEGKPGPGWGLSVYKLKQIDDYSKLSRLKIRSIYNQGDNRFVLWSILFKVESLDDLPMELKAYVEEMKIPFLKFKKFGKLKTRYHYFPELE